MSTAEPQTIVFVCRHGAAKSVLAAALAERRAAELGLQITALARGIEPEPVLSPQLEVALPGIEPRIGAPQLLTETDVHGASAVVTFDLEPSELPVAVRTTRWDGIPAVSLDPLAARAELEERLARFLGTALDPDAVPG